MPIVAKSFTPSAKTIELIIYIASKMKNKLNYGATLLGKSLYLIDSMSFLKNGHPITEFSYIKQERGPTPNPIQFLPVREELVKAGEMEKIEAQYFGRTQNKFIAKREPKIDVFDKDEIYLIDDVLESISDHNASEISNLSHQFIAWIFAQDKEELPFYTFLISNTDPDIKDVAWANKSIKEYKATNKNAS